MMMTLRSVRTTGGELHRRRQHHHRHHVGRYDVCDGLSPIIWPAREVGGLFEMRVFVVPRYPSRGSVPVCKMEDHTEVELYECVNKSFGGL